MTAKPIKSLELHYTMIQFLIKADTGTGRHPDVPQAVVLEKEMEETQQSSSVISVKPVSSLIDDKVIILASKLEPNQIVTLEARIVGDKGEVFESHAHYVADNEGVLGWFLQWS